MKFSQKFSILLLIKTWALMVCDVNSLKLRNVAANETVAVALKNSTSQAITTESLRHSKDHNDFLNVEHIKNGMPLNFSFNETNNPLGDGIPSSPGCPKSYHGFPWVYFGDPPSCYLVGSQGPCPPGQLLFGNSSSNTGHCGCFCPARIKETRGMQNDSIYANVTKSPSIKFCRLKELPDVNEVASFGENGTCMFLETQGFCSAGEWMVKNEAGDGVMCIPECSPIYGSVSAYFFDSKKSACGKRIELAVLPVSLASSMLGPGSCEDGMVYSKLLKKCIPKSKAFFHQFG